MQLNALLKICLQAVAHRYPNCIVERNSTTLAFLGVWEDDCSPERALEQLRTRAPFLLEMPACLEINMHGSESTISLLRQDGASQAFRLYCGACFRAQRRKHFLHELNTSMPLVP